MLRMFHGWVDVESVTSSYGWVVTDSGEYCPDCAERHLPKPSAADLNRRWQPWPDLFEGGPL